MALMDKKFALVLGVLQICFLGMFIFFTDYDDVASASHVGHSRDNGSDPNANPLKDYYPMFQDVHVMIFVGFGFLMTFLKRYGYSSVGLNMLVSSFVIQWALLGGGLLHHMGDTIHINIQSMLVADFACAAVLITFGAVLGKTSPLQLIVIAYFEIIFFAINEMIGVSILGAVDIGGSMFVHVFGAYFGLSVARMLYNNNVEESEDEGSNYHSDLFSMIGTIFLWMYWPSFNSALAPGDDQHRAVINTYLALAACCVTTFALSSALDKHNKFDMVHVQNATLAGGVAVGTSADMMIRPWGAITIGILAGSLSVIGFKYITPFLSSKKFHDTCGVNNLHGMPGVLAGICGAVAAAFASVDVYGYSLFQVFPARAPEANSTELAAIHEVFSAVSPGEGRDATTQFLMQFLALIVTLLFALVGGAITGFIVRLSFFDQPVGADKPIFDDTLWWETPDDLEPPNHRSKVNTTEDKLLTDINDESKI